MALSLPSPPAADLAAALAAPFEASEVKFKPAVVTGNRALALAYVDARVIQDRLDDVMGVMGWQDSYKVLADGAVMCRLRLLIDGQWIGKVDVGGRSEQPDDGDRTKAAFSDALKRAAVKFGIGRYLYRLPQQWCDWDPQKRQFVKVPTVPAAALPAKKADRGNNSPAKPESKPAAVPASGAELHRRLTDYDVRLAAQGVCRAGDLLAHIARKGIERGYAADLMQWNGPAIALAIEETKAFEAARRQPARQGAA